MKKFLSQALTVVISIGALTLFTPSSYAGMTVSLTSAPNRQINGEFIDDSLAARLLPSGSLGKQIYENAGYISSLYIDPSLIEDVQAMTKGYKIVGGTKGTGEIVAKTWLAQLARVSNGAHVYSIVYGNPSEYWVKKFASHDREYFLSLSSSRLSTLLGRFVYPGTTYLSTEYFSLYPEYVRALQDSENMISASAGYMNSADLEQLKLNSLKMMNKSLPRSSRSLLYFDLLGTIEKVNNSVRMSTGKFTITSNGQKLPVTISNDFPQQVKVNLTIRSINERIVVGDQSNIVVGGKSKVQILVPVEVNASGDSGFTISIKDSFGNSLGEKVTYPVKVSVVSPIATWITGAAGLTLLIAAILQSLRRIRRGKK